MFGKFRQLRGFCLSCNTQQYIERIFHSLENARIENLPVRQRHQSGIQCQKMPGQIAAVNCGDIVRWQGFESLGIVPVVEMTSMPLQCARRRESVARALDKLTGLQVTEIVSG